MIQFISFLNDWYQKITLKQRRLIGAILAGSAGFGVLFGYFMTAPGPESYMMAEKAVEKWEQIGDTSSYLEMRKALKKVPTLDRKYNAVIAQKLFQKDRLSDALSLAHASIKQIENEAPFHAAYGKTTILIEQGSFQDALEKSVGLKERLSREYDFLGSRDDAPGLFLYVHNLLRIACLQKELKNGPGEKAAWDELERFLSSKESLSQHVFNNFRSNGLDLSHYIGERKKQL